MRTVSPAITLGGSEGKLSSPAADTAWANDFGPGGAVSGDERNDQEQIGGAIEGTTEQLITKKPNHRRKQIGKR